MVGKMVILYRTMIAKSVQLDILYHSKRVQFSLS